MAHPKHRKSRSKSRMRRSHDALTAPTISTCQKCGDPKLPHRLCAGCGTYKGRTVVQFEAENLE